MVFCALEGTVFVCDPHLFSFHSQSACVPNEEKLFVLMFSFLGFFIPCVFRHPKQMGRFIPFLVRSGCLNCDYCRISLLHLSVYFLLVLRGVFGGVILLSTDMMELRFMLSILFIIEIIGSVILILNAKIKCSGSCLKKKTKERILEVSSRNYSK